MSLANAVQPVHPAEVPRAMLAQQNQPLVHIGSAVGHYPGGGGRILPTFPGGTARSPRFCFLCEMINV
jgi:hypothetical protein